MARRQQAMKHFSDLRNLLACPRFAMLCGQQAHDVAPHVPQGPHMWRTAKTANSHRKFIAGRCVAQAFQHGFPDFFNAGFNTRVRGHLHEKADQA